MLLTSFSVEDGWDERVEFEDGYYIPSHCVFHGQTYSGMRNCTHSCTDMISCKPKKNNAIINCETTECPNVFGSFFRFVY